MDDLIAKYYQQELGRAPEEEGAKYWTDKLNQGWTEADLQAAINNSAEAREYDAMQRFRDVGPVKDYEGKEYDPVILIKLAQQISQNFDPTRSSGGAFSTKGESIGFDAPEASRLLGREATAPQQVILDMARGLMNKGVTDLNQLKYGEYDRGPVERHYGDGEFLTVPGGMGKDFLLNGKPLDGILGQTYTGKGNTSYHMDVDPVTGKPKFFTQANSSSDVGAIMPLIAVASMGLGLPGLIGQGLAGTGASALAQGTLLNSALSQGIMSGALSGLAGGDVGKGFIGGAIGPVVGGAINSALPADLGAPLKGGISKAAANMASTAIRGGDPMNALTGGILSGVVDYGLDKTGALSDLSPTQKALATGILGPALAGKKIDPISLMMRLPKPLNQGY